MIYPANLNDQESVRSVPDHVSDELSRASSDYERSAGLVSSLASALTDKIKQLEVQVNEIASRVAAMQVKSGAQTYKIYDLLDNPNDSTFSTLEADPNSGGLSLKVESYENLSPTIQDIKLKGVGIPGNSVVQRIAPIAVNDTNPTVFMTRDTDNHANFLMVFDKNNDTWFEWESVVIPPKQPLQQIGRAWIAGGTDTKDVREVTNNLDWTVSVFDPGQDKPREDVPQAVFKEFPGPEDLARLEVSFELDDLKEDMLLDLSPYIIGNFPLVVEYVRTSIDGVRWEDQIKTSGPGLKIKNENDLVKTVRIWLGRAKWVKIGLRAGGWYQPRNGIGHDFFAVQIHEQFKQRILFWSRTDDRYWWERHSIGKRGVGTIVYTEETPAGQTAKLVGFVAGVAYEWATGVIRAKIGEMIASVLGGNIAAMLGPVGLAVLAVGVISAIASAFFEETKTREVIAKELGVDVFRGWRSAIGIREIQLVRAKFKTSGAWVSRKYIFPDKVREVSLRASHSVPDGTSIRYSVSHDGSSWMEIQPDGTPLQLASPTSNLFVRIEMESQDSKKSPLVTGFLLEGSV